MTAIPYGGAPYAGSAPAGEPAEPVTVTFTGSGAFTANPEHLVNFVGTGDPTYTVEGHVIFSGTGTLTPVGPKITFSGIGWMTPTQTGHITFTGTGTFDPSTVLFYLTGTGDLTPTTNGHFPLTGTGTFIATPGGSIVFGGAGTFTPRSAPLKLRGEGYVYANPEHSVTFTGSGSIALRFSLVTFSGTGTLSVGDPRLVMLGVGTGTLTPFVKLITINKKLAAMITLPIPAWSVETEDAIRSRMLALVDAAFNVAEGDFMYDCVTPSAIEIAKVYNNFTTQANNAFISNATGTYLDGLAETFWGMTRTAGETDTAFRARVLVVAAAPPGAGTVSDWEAWALESTSAPAVAYASASPIWDGPGTVKIYATDSAKSVLSAPDLALLQTHLEGYAPIGVTVTADTITTLTTTVTATLHITDGFNATTVAAAADTIIDAYVDGIALGGNLVYNALFKALMCDVEGVDDVSTMTLNGGTANISMSAQQAAVNGSHALATV